MKGKSDKFSEETSDDRKYIVNLNLNSLIFNICIRTIIFSNYRTVSILIIRIISFHIFQYNTSFQDKYAYNMIKSRVISAWRVLPAGPEIRVVASLQRRKVENWLDPWSGAIHWH